MVALHNNDDSTTSTHHELKSGWVDASAYGIPVEKTPLGDLPFTSPATDVPHREEQWKEIRAAIDAPLVVQDKRYLVPADWWAAWELYVTDDTQPPPGAMDLSVLIETRIQTIVFVKPTLMYMVDFYAVDEKAWNRLVRWYGFKGWRLERRVMLSREYGQLDKPVLEVHPRYFYCYRVVDSLPEKLCKPVLIDYSRMDNSSGFRARVLRGMMPNRFAANVRLYALPLTKAPTNPEQGLVLAKELYGMKHLELGSRAVALWQVEELNDVCYLAVDVEDSKRNEGAWLVEPDAKAVSRALASEGFGFSNADAAWQPVTTTVALRTNTKIIDDDEDEAPPLYSASQGETVYTSNYAKPSTSKFDTYGSSYGSTRSYDYSNSYGTKSYSSYGYGMNTYGGGNANSALEDGEVPAEMSGALAQRVEIPGKTGLQNLGNTCFMNSALQCLNAVKELSLLCGVEQKHIDEINEDNPLGMNGQVAYHYGHLVDRLWRGPSSIFSPKEFKFTIGRFAPAFNGYSQHDAQEFLSFLLDGLHEDLNRIQKKPYVEHPEPNGRPERELADEAWELHKKRNDSIVVDLFHGLYRSQLHCPECDNISIKFDPFMYLTLPIPYQSKIDIKVLYIPPNELSLPGWIDLRLLYPATGLDMKKALLNRLKLSESGKSLNSLVILQVKNDYYSQSAQIVADVDAIGGKYAAGKYFIYHLPCEFPSEDHVTVLGVHAVGSKDDELDADETNTTEDDASMNDGKHGPYGRQSSYYSNYSPIKPFGIPMLIPIPIQDAGTLEGVYRRLTDASQRFTSGCLYKDYIPPAMESESEYTGTTESELVEGSTGDSLGDTMDEDELTTFIPASSDENDITEDEDAITEDEDMSTGSNKKQRVSSPNPYTMHYSTLPLSVKEFIPKPDMFKMKKCIRPSSMHLGRILERELELLKPTDGHTFTLEGKEVRSLLFDGELVVVEWLPTVKRILFGDEVTMDEPRPTSSNFNSAMPYGGASDEEDTPVDKPKAPTRYKKPMVSTDISHMSHLFNTYETYTAPLGPDPQGQFSLRQCLQEFAKEEQLGPSEAWYCPKCKKHQQAMKKMSIWKLPKVLVVHLKRFESRSNKIDVPVDFPIKDLSLDDWVAEEALKEGEEQDKTYDLFGIVNHVGQLYWGHYTAYAKNFANNRWYHFNDSFTEEVRDVRKTIQTRQAYLLFYKQREDTDDLRTEIPEPSVSGTTVHGISNTIYSMNMSRTSLAHGSRSDSLGHAYNPRRHANSPTNSNSPILQPGSKDSNMTEMTDSDGEHGWDNLSTKYGNSSHMSMEDEDHFLNDDYIQVSDDEDDKETRARDAW